MIARHPSTSKSQRFVRDLIAASSYPPNNAARESSPSSAKMSLLLLAMIHFLLLPLEADTSSEPIRPSCPHSTRACYEEERG